VGRVLGVGEEEAGRGPCAGPVGWGGARPFRVTALHWRMLPHVMGGSVGLWR
jgi:hypothetical protein